MVVLLAPALVVAETVACGVPVPAAVWLLVVVLLLELLALLFELLLLPPVAGMPELLWAKTLPLPITCPALFTVCSL